MLTCFRKARSHLVLRAIRHLSILSTGLLGDSTVSTGSRRASRSAKALRDKNVTLIGSGKEQPSTPDRLGDHIEDGKEEDLFVRVELGGTLAKSESNGVEGPDDNESKRDLVVETADLGAAEESGGSARSDELEENPSQGDAREGEETPLAGLGRVNTSNDTSDNHDLVGKDEDDDLSNGQASKESKVEKKERGGQSPVEVYLREKRQNRSKAKRRVSVFLYPLLCRAESLLKNSLFQLQILLFFCTYIERSRIRGEDGDPRQ